MSGASPSQHDVAARRLLVVGDAMLDRYWFGAVERISPEAPVPVVRVQRQEDRLGGAANVALNIKELGADVTLLTVMGDDDGAQRLRALLSTKSIDAVVGQDAQAQTIVKLRVIGRAQQLVRVDFESEPTHEVLGRMLDDFRRLVVSHDAVVFSDYGKGGLAHIPHMIETARAAGKAVLVDPKGSDYRRYTGATVITPNRGELAQVVGAWEGESVLCERAQALRRDLQLGAVLLTRSEEGMTLYDECEPLHVPAEVREVFDVTGAGDTVIAVLATMVACGLSLREAVPIANRAAGIVVSKFGTATTSFAEVFA